MDLKGSGIRFVGKLEVRSWKLEGDDLANYKDLKVWQKAMDLVVDVYSVINDFPQIERFALSDQIRRCSVSIPSNIAEGAGRNHIKEFVQFLSVSLGSLYELQTQLEIAKRVGYITNTNIQELDKKTLEIEKMLNALISSIKKGNQ